MMRGIFVPRSTMMMDQAASRVLKDIVARHGQAVVAHPRRCEGLLRDWCPQLGRERKALIGTLKEKVPQNLLSAAGENISEAVVIRYADEITKKIGLDKAVARWSVETWAQALGLHVKVNPPDRLCPFCGSPAPDQICASCGRDTTAPRRPCPKCGRLTPSTEQTCWNCGATFTSEMRWKIPLIIGLFVLAFALSVFIGAMR